jgi:hypothetical protein
MNVRYRLHVRTMYVTYVVAVHIRESLFCGFANYKSQVAPENRWRIFHFSTLCWTPRGPAGDYTDVDVT